MARNDLINEYINKYSSYNEFKKLTPKMQKTITSSLVSAMNKRIKRLGKSDIGRLSPTYQAYERRGSYYSVKGLSGDALYNRFQSLSESMKKATSLRDWKKLRRETLEKLNLNDLTLKQEKSFWNFYRRFQEDNTQFKQYKKEISDRVLTYVAKTFEDKGYRYNKETKSKILKWLEEEYEKQQQKEKAFDRGISQLISDDEEEEY